jgi:hypothetical protein
MIRRDVRFEEKAFRKSYDVPTTTKDQELVAPKEEHESQVQVTRTCTDTGTWTSTQIVE